MDVWLKSIEDWAVPVIAVSIILLSLCGITMGVRYIWLMLFHRWFIYLWHKLVRNPMSWLLRPLQRAYSRWSDRNLREKMAKWKRELIANIFYDGLTQACDEHLISKHDKRRLMKRLAQFFEIADLKRPNNHQQALKKKILENREFEIGPKGPIPGGKPGEDVIPVYKFEGLGAKFLSRKNGKKVA